MPTTSKPLSAASTTNATTKTTPLITVAMAAQSRQHGWCQQRATPGPALRHPLPASVSVQVMRSLVVKVTAGKDEAERCNQAFTVAATAAASGVQVSLWLTAEASWFAVRGRSDDLALPHAAPISELLPTILAAGTVTLCTQCAARRGIGENDVIEGIRIAGAATFVAEVLADDAQALVY
jgi:predicted peroxiredoxin